MNKLKAAVLAAGLVLAAAPANATVTFDYIFDGGFPLSVSTDGSVVAGNLANGGFGAYRWTQGTGVVPLGRQTWGGGAGMTVMSADGTKIAATIGSLDSTYNTQGLWTLARSPLKPRQKRLSSRRRSSKPGPCTWRACVW